MKLIYEYRTGDNVKHEGTVHAADVDDAYAKLKKEGIKPSRVTPAPGFFNRFTLRHKLLVAVGSLVALCLVLAYLALHAQDARNNAQGTPFVPTPAFLSLQADAEKIVEESGTNGVANAREKLQAIFRDRYPQLVSDREREEGEKLYGRQMILLDRLESISRRKDF